MTPTRYADKPSTLEIEGSESLRNTCVSVLKKAVPIRMLGLGRTRFYVNTEARPWVQREDRARRAAVNAFAYSDSTNMQSYMHFGETTGKSLNRRVIRYVDIRLDPQSLLAQVRRIT